MFDPYFFGYGSLVNRATHEYRSCHPAKLTGWKRAWRHTSLRPVAYLTAVPAAGVTIQGLIAAVPSANWVALDEREHAYDRHAAPHVAHPLDPKTDVQVYAIAAGKHLTPTSNHPILLSYLDVVVQGYLREFGTKGVKDFFETTDGWDAPIKDDRREPIYPRHQKLDHGETQYVDEMLAAMGANILR